MTETRPAFTGPELCALEAHEVVAMLKRGDITPRDCIDAALARIARVEPAINAIPTLCEDRARAAADALESSAGNDHSNAAGWLAGLPLGIKDLSDVAGVRTTYGTKGYAGSRRHNSLPARAASHVSVGLFQVVHGCPKKT